MENLLNFTNKNIVVMGVANDRSIAWGIAKSLFSAGAHITFTYRKERSLAKLERLLTDVDSSTYSIVQCDVNSDDSIQEAFKKIGEERQVIHGIVHSVASSLTEDLKNRFVETSREGYAFAQDTSAYSLIAVSKAAKPYLTDNGSIVTMSYLGAARVLEGYNVMGIAKASLEASVRYLAADIGRDNIRVNAISAGPIKTISAKAVPSFNQILNKIEEAAPLRRNITQEEVANMTLVMLSPISSGVTGEVTYVDAGYNILGI